MDVLPSRAPGNWEILQHIPAWSGLPSFLWAQEAALYSYGLRAAVSFHMVFWGRRREIRPSFMRRLESWFLGDSRPFEKSIRVDRDAEPTFERLNHQVFLVQIPDSDTVIAPGLDDLQDV